MSLEKIRIERIGNSLLPLLNENVSILDIGCGNGALGDYLSSKKKFSYYGVDLVLHNNQKLDNFIKSSFPYPFKDKSFDTVLVILTLHHFENPEVGLKEAIRLSNNKILILEDVPRNFFEKQCMKIVDFLGNRWVSKEIPLPFSFYSDDEWKYLFLKHDLKLKNKINVFPLPFPRLNHFLYEVFI